MTETLTPADEGVLGEVVAAALAKGTSLEVVGGGSKRALGRHAPQAVRVSTSALTGITLYEPDELVLSAGTGTPMAEIESLLAEHGQHLAFEPPDWRALLGDDATGGGPTIGGVIACNLSGPRRLRAGAARDHFLGVRCVSGRGEVFKSGGRVIKNVTGYDMCKLLAGSYGTLAVIAEVTVKVLPAPERVRTALVVGLNDARAVALLSQALGSPCEISAAAHLPAAIAARSAVGYVRDAGAAVTALRIDGFAPSVDARLEAIRAMIGAHGAVEELHRHNSFTLWREVGDATAFAGNGRAVWRLSVPPASGPAVVARVREAIAAEAYYDWGGGLVWLAVDEGEDAAHEVVRAALGATGGHATLIRADAGLRARIPVFQPPEPGAAALAARVKEGFDPRGILNPGRMYDGV